MLSILIPNRNNGKGHNFCKKTVEDVLKNAGTDLEVLVYVDEAWPEVVKDKRVHYIHPPSPRGLRNAVNELAKMSKGDYLLKCDDHVAFGENFGKILIESHEKDNWVQIPRRYALDPINWKIETRTDDKYPVDYMYIDFPRKGKAHDDGMHGVPWKQRREERKDILIDDTPTMQGSCYFMTRNHFLNTLKGLDETYYGHFAQESQEINFKTWLSGGECKVNKKTWYAHLHKGRVYGRMYNLSDPDHVKGAEWSAQHWLNNREPNMKYPFEWLIEKFSPMPTWSENWKEEIKEMGWIN